MPLFRLLLRFLQASWKPSTASTVRPETSPNTVRYPQLRVSPIAWKRRSALAHLFALVLRLGKR
jgi:hypothetical protein